MKYEPKKSILPGLGPGDGGVVFKDGAVGTEVPARNCWRKFAISCSSCSAENKINKIKPLKLKDWSIKNCTGSNFKY